MIFIQIRIAEDIYLVRVFGDTVIAFIHNAINMVYSIWGKYLVGDVNVLYAV